MSMFFVRTYVATALNYQYRYLERNSLFTFKVVVIRGNGDERTFAGPRGTKSRVKGLFEDKPRGKGLKVRRRRSQ